MSQAPQGTRYQTHQLPAIRNSSTRLPPDLELSPLQSRLLGCSSIAFAVGTKDRAIQVLALGQLDVGPC